jgi:DNA-directed RNA polymerase subunit RPC12/RpoP
MSEYKYACPVCGQHMSCDSSQAGTVMECPTCFQKITAPQAPADADQKFVLTGTKVGDRPVPKMPAEGPAAGSAGKNSPLGIIVVMVIIIALIGAGAAVFAFRGKIFKSTNAPVEATDDTNQTPANEQSPPKPVVVAPPANDTNWTLNLDSVTNLPDATASGRIHGQNFIVERAFLQNGTLTLREGRTGPVELGVQINFGGAQPEALAEKTINVTTNALMAAHVTLRWKDAELDARQGFDGNYAMRLEFGTLANNRMPGKIYFCAPDEMKSYVAGTFNVEIRKPKPKAPPKK